MADAITPPRPEEAEFSAFGPGYGECLLIHLGEGDWMIVDSCKQSSRVPVLDYLRSMDVDPATAVKLVVATHWHDDHIRGMRKVLATCRTATFACSAALSHDELLQAIGRLEPSRGGRLTSGVKEMRTVLELLAADHARPAADRARPQSQWAMQDRLLHRRRGTLDCDVHALAPCDRVLRSAYQNVVRLVEQGANVRVPKPDRNIGAVVLWVEVGDATMLLGSDLQESPGGGWTAVLSCQMGFDRRSEIFKVPHHGSSNGHLDLVWQKILVDRPEAVVCPYRKGAHSLPTEGDLQRLCEMATVHLTAPSGPRTVMRKGRLMRPSVGDLGRVTLRRRLGIDTVWSVSYGGQAGAGCP